ncbi:hypothetical protein LTR17_014481 [Elasticomyces elasticus]|nr:hypothetical protein LTR17_014481 [Elasticomyces elasticus]
MDEKRNAEHGEHSPEVVANLTYDDFDEEPELHARTYVALAAMFMLNLVQVFALQGPPAVLSYIGQDLQNAAAETWITNALSLVQAVLGPVLASVSDTFQARKIILVSTCLISFVGSAIAPGSTSIYRLIVAQILIGAGFAVVPLAYCVPSEILPRKWRPMAQGAMNVASSLGAIASPLIIGALTRNDVHNGWRRFYWIQMALWGITALGLLFGYRPPVRHTRLDHLSLFQKIKALDLIGFGLLSAGLALFLTGLNLGGGLYIWTDSRVLGTLVSGILVLISFVLYEWKGTKTGILHHDLFSSGKEQGRTFAVCAGLLFIEGIMLFSIIIFYPVFQSLREGPFLEVARAQPFWIACACSTLVYGYVSTKRRTIRTPMFIGFVLFTAGLVGLASIEPDDSTNAIVFDGLAGLGFGAPLVLIVAGVQLSTPHHLIATATAVTTSARAVAATTFTAIFSAALNARLAKYIPAYTSNAALGAELPPSSVPAFVTAQAGLE